MKHIHILLLAIVAILWLSCSNSDDPTFDNPLDPKNGAGLPVPESVSVTVGNNLVRLDWSLPAGEVVDDFVIFRRRLQPEPPTVLRQVKRVVEKSYQDSSVRNGEVYEYQIAAGRKGGVGERSEPVEARPGLFAIVISNDLPRTREQTVSVLLQAQGVQAVRLAEDPDSLVGPWRPMSASVSWRLSPGDGKKILHAVFQYSDGSESVPVSDSIELDTQATIRTIDFDGAAIRYPGDTIRFRLDAGEPDGVASVRVVGLFDMLPLFDDGTNGDSARDDGVYERSALVPAGKIVQNASISASFTDEVGNQATVVEGARALTVLKNPDAVSLLQPVTAEPPDAAAVTLRWTRSLESGFASYEVLRDNTASVDSSDRLLVTLTNASTVEFKDEDVIEGETYFYRVYVLVQSGPRSGSNVVQATVVNLRPPAVVNLQSPSAIGATRLSLTWGKVSDLDFSTYKVYRNETGAVSEGDVLVAEIHDGDTTFLDDTGLLDNTRYYYRVFTLDEGGLSSRSNEVAATTVNEAPDAVVLSEQSPANMGEVTLAWTESSAHDFAYYRLYRAENPNVSTTSTLLVEIDNQSVTSFLDTNLNAATKYYYRVFVVDSDEHTEAKSTGSNTVTVLQDGPPDQVSLKDPDATSSTRISLTWSKATATDLFAYRLYRNETGAVGEDDTLIAEITEADRTFWDDTALVENTTYYYRVYTEDLGGLTSRSNEVSATTVNVAPQAVTLQAASAIDSTEATLSWTASTEHDFASYRLYRDEVPTVTTSSTLVVEIDEAGSTSFRDTALEASTQYYYRVYVVDDGTNPGSESTGSNTVNFSTL